MLDWITISTLLFARNVGFHFSCGKEVVGMEKGYYPGDFTGFSGEKDGEKAVQVRDSIIELHILLRTSQQGIKKTDVPSTSAAPVLTVGHNAKKRKTSHSNWKGKAERVKEVKDYWTQYTRMCVDHFDLPQKLENTINLRLLMILIDMDIGNRYHKKGQNPSKTRQNRAQNEKRGKVKSQPKSTKSQPDKFKATKSKEIQLQGLKLANLQTYTIRTEVANVENKEPSYNQNYNDNYYPYDLPSSPCCDNCGDLMKLSSVNRWTKISIFPYSKPEDPNELFQKLLRDLKELAEYENSQSRDRPTFLNDDEDHSDQNKECFENSSDEIEQKKKMEDTMLELIEICRQKELYCMHDNVEDLIESALNSKLLPINSNSQRLDNKEQEVKNVVEQPVERKTHIEKSLQKFRVIHKSSISFNTSQISPVHAVAPILSTKETEHPLSMGYENLNTTPKTESDEIIKSGVEELVPIPNECEVISEDKRECNVLSSEDSSTCDVCDNHSDILSDSNDDDISSDDDDFEDIEYVEASLSDPEIVNQEEEEVNLEDVSQIQDTVLREKLLSITHLIVNIESLNDNPTSDRVINSSVSIPIFEESDKSLSDNFSLEFETFCDNTEETRSGNTNHANDSLPVYDSFCFEIEPDQERLINVLKNNISDDSNDPLLEKADLFLASDNSIPSGIENFGDDSEGDIHFLEELLIDDCIISHESSDSNFEDNPSFPLPPPGPPDVETDARDEISVVINDLECLDSKAEFDNDDYYSFMFVKVFSFLSVESEDTIFDLGFTPHRLKFLVSDICPGPKDLHILCLRIVWGNPYP
nr:hypothetical protein [Tanacetum cinerariifolium]